MPRYDLMAGMAVLFALFPVVVWYMYDAFTTTYLIYFLIADLIAVPLITRVMWPEVWDD